ncbi:MAG: tyrosine-type recombinase/integrase [Lewinellaceae bacterium]|nr:site-specific integrase [Saprospiraceae bacterium]MCB9338424.1 tyrosine-type recombinase/integrase [Lewinellaceae bacterium]
MATTKIVLRRKQNQDGTYPLALRITKDRKSTYVFLDQSIKEKLWDSKQSRVKSSHPNSARLNNYLLKKLNDANSTILELELKHKEITLQTIREALSPKHKNNTFFAQVELYFEPLITEGKYNRISADRPAFNHFRRFLKGKDILFKDITIQLLERFKAHLKGDLKVTERTAFNHLILIRTIYKRAIASGVVDASNYPFGINKFRLKRPESLKIGLDAGEVSRLETIELSADDYECHARNIWLFSFYFAGMRASDVLLLRWSDFDDTRLHYVMEKNDKPGSLRIPEKAKAILSQYRHLKKNDHDLVFSDLKGFDLDNKMVAQKQIKNVIRRLNFWLKKIAKEANIKKPLTMHIARHSFGNISGDRIPVQMLQKLYRHSNIETTVNYQRAFNRGVDEALDAVLDF